MNKRYVILKALFAVVVDRSFFVVFFFRLRVGKGEKVYLNFSYFYSF